MPHLEVSEVILVCFDIFNNEYQQEASVLYTFVRNKSFGRLQEISPTNFIFLPIINSELLYIELR